MASSSDTYRIDSHKLMFHPERIARWLAGEAIYPIYVELSPSGACNHRCVFCAFDFMRYRARFLDAKMLEVRLAEMSGLGVKSISLAGEGEPLLHPDIAKIAECAKRSGLDVAFTTNGSLLTNELALRLLPVSSWIKVSCNAGTPESYANVHRTNKDTFEVVMRNLQNAVSLREKHDWKCTLGLQILLLPEVADEVVGLAKRCRDIGLDYIVVKPYSQHLKSGNREYEAVSYAEFGGLAENMETLKTSEFHAFFRTNAMKKWDEKTRPYERCLALPFWAYVDSGANVWGCFNHLKDDRFCYGNLNEKTFAEIWRGQERRSKLAWAENDMAIDACRIGCRMDEINRYLWELRHPGEHVNFV
jgi:wyosine [tRNA(Phe)-imidazoG37] synthetase (radical SAM superfamily)